MGKFSRRQVLLAGGAAAAVAVAGGTLGLSILRKRPKNVVFVIMDAVRRDRIGLRGPNGKSLTPFIDTAMAEGTVFTGCIASSSWTLPSVAGIVTSRIPIVTGGYYSESFAKGAKTIAEALAAAGYFTFAVVKNPWLPIRTATGEAVPTVVTQGFEHYAPGAVILQPNPLFAKGIGQEKEFFAFPPAEKAVDEAIATLKARGPGDKRPFFLYLHFMNTHEPYSPSEREMPLADAAAPRVEDVPDHLIYKVIRYRGAKRGKDVLADEDTPLMARAQALYNAGVASTDAAIARLAEHLTATGQYDDTVFVITADHGEEFGEHGWFGHTLTLYQEVLKVPLVLWGPGIPRGRKVEAIASGVDVAPGILAAAGCALPDGMEGAALPFRAGAEPREAVSSTVLPALPKKIDTVLTSLIDPSGKKLIVKYPADGVAPQKSVEMYDLVADPGEKTSLMATDVGSAAAAAIMARHIDQYTSNAARRGQGAAFAIDDETKMRLRSLGYFE